MITQASSHRFPVITTVLDTVSDNPHRLLYSGSIRNALAKLLPPDFFFAESSEGKEGGDFDGAAIEELHKILPVIRMAEWGESPYNISVFLLTRHRPNAVKFFYEMIHRWLLPGRRLNISSFFATDFKLPELTNEVFTVSEMVISVGELDEMEIVRSNLPILETEIRLGLISVYHANRILEIKGLSADQKTSLIQERIASLLEKRPNDFDSDIFTQMQHFLVMCNEEFKGAREYGHMSRIIYVFYLFRKAIQQQVENVPGVRHLTLKLCKTKLHLPFGTKRVLGVFVGMNFLNDNEIFEERHLIKAIKVYFPHISVVADSNFVSSLREDKIQLLYLELEKSSGEEFSLAEIKMLKERLSEDLKNGVEKLMRPLFMPRNEEEVMRNIITLAQQLRYPRDLPQVIISFEEQTDLELSFTIIILRVLQKGMPSIQELFQRSKTFLKFIPDRVKIVGTLRKKYPKEATVFRVRLPASSFLRQDHSVDLLKARHVVTSELQRIVGEVRDYNGGMISKQQEQFLGLKCLFPNMSRREEILLENFFHSIFPIELRSVVSPQILKNLFSILLEAVEKNKDAYQEKEVCFKEEGAVLYVLISYQDINLKEKMIENVAHLHIPSSQLATLSLQAFDVRYLGFVLQTEDKAKRKALVSAVQKEC
ncbi:MAG: hypothetical protein JSR93_09215 [Verrucomicrobia bacterium]|nr:hypothetical protein [Verrucomicrobiota bacterium]